MQHDINPDWLRDQVAGGRSLADIARDVGCDKSTISRHCKRLGIATAAFNGARSSVRTARRGRVVDGPTQRLTTDLPEALYWDLRAYALRRRTTVLALLIQWIEAGIREDG